MIRRSWCKIERNADARGFFARTFCVQEFAEAGLPTAAGPGEHLLQRADAVRCAACISSGRLRAKAKLVRCIRGACSTCCSISGPNSPSYLRHVSVELDDESRDAVFIPHGVAHGFQTLADSTEVLYQMTDCLRPGRWRPAYVGTIRASV